MDKRNQISIAIISFIVIVGAIATPLMIRDHVDIFDDFINSPIIPPHIPDEGLLNLYYTSDFTEENATIVPLEVSSASVNEKGTIERIWIIITDITLLGKKAGNSQFFTSDDEFDLLDAYNETQLLKSGNITAAEYAGIQLHFNSTIMIQTDIDIYYFEIQGNNVISLPFNMFYQVNNQVDLDILGDTINDVLLDFKLEILWQNSTARIMTKAYVM
ncbi:MAG: hypothetical protein GOP50_10630 [Candidatus Heimdallarchaeota archaeon]|nr:hypothetical protein [Candidatus Heimdallarchaeota archaeon]